MNLDETDPVRMKTYTKWFPITFRSLHKNAHLFTEKVLDFFFMKAESHQIIGKKEEINFFYVNDRYYSLKYDDHIDSNERWLENFNNFVRFYKNDLILIQLLVQVGLKRVIDDSFVIYPEEDLNIINNVGNYVNITNIINITCVTEPQIDELCNNFF